MKSIWSIFGVAKRCSLNALAPPKNKMTNPFHEGLGKTRYYRSFKNTALHVWCENIQMPTKISTYSIVNKFMALKYEIWERFFFMIQNRKRRFLRWVIWGFQLITNRWVIRYASFEHHRSHTRTRFEIKFIFPAHSHGTCQKWCLG